MRTRMTKKDWGLIIAALAYYETLAEDEEDRQLLRQVDRTASKVAERLNRASSAQVLDTRPDPPLRTHQ